MEHNYKLKIRYGTSRAYGYEGQNTMSLKDVYRNKRVAYVVGGGYDMHGAILGEWIQSEFQEELKTLDASKHNGMYPPNEKGKVYINGCSGERCMHGILKDLGYDIWDVGYRKGSRLYFITKIEEAKQA